jgi:hypothetical protein
MFCQPKTGSISKVIKRVPGRMGYNGPEVKWMGKLHTAMYYLKTGF